MSLKIRSAALALLLCSACATVSPRFSPEIAESFARDDMRRLETKSLVVYYPAHAKEPTLQTLARLEKCAETLRGMSEPRTKRPKLVILVTSAEFNNAYVEAQAAGSPTQMVIPVQMGEEVFNFFDFGVTNIGDIGCHESVHYVQLEHTEGFWKYVNLVFGDVASPNLGTETWFLEGLATYFEGHLGIAAGRPHSPIWNGMYDSGVASQAGHLQAGQLSPENRELYPFGGNYLAGSHFIGWLVKTYGEEKLWKLIDVQGRSIFFPFGVTLRVKSVYGLSLGALLDEYNKALSVELGARPRPGDQQVLSDDQGYFARLASGPSGELASITVGLEHISRLEVREPDGALRFSTPLVQLLPFRPYISTSPTSASGLSFTADGRWLFVFFEDVASNSGSTYAVRQYDARTGHFERSWKGLRGVGGSVLPDGSGYVFVDIHDAIPELARLNFASGRITHLTDFGSRDPLGAPAVSPDGRQIAFSRFEHGGFNLYLRDAEGMVRPLIRDGRFNYGARWINADQLLLERETDSGQSQAYVLDLPSGQLTQQTHAPFAVFDPVPAANGRIAFLNREGWKWTLDSAPLLTAANAPAECTQAAVIQPLESLPHEPVSTLTIENDQRYSMLDEFFIPRLRVPFAAATFDPLNHLQPYVAASVMGFDRLGMNAWAINATFDGYDRQPSVSVAYGNALLAPWYLTAAVSRAVSRRALYRPDAEITSENVVGSGLLTDWSATVSASRPFWTTDVALSVSALQRTDERSLDETGTFLTRHTRLLGPSASMSWFAGANTPYAGTRVGIAADLSGSVFPKAFGSDINLADLRAAFTGWIPLPVLPRQSFSVGVRGRWVPGSSEPLLQLGGVPSGYALSLRDANQESAPFPDLLLPPTVSFIEPLRGFDDVSFQVKAAAIVSARYRYPFIIDRGTMSFLYILPSFFMRQIDVEGFFDGARTDEPVHNLHGAAGAAIRFRTLWGSVLPISLYYQYAYRFDPGFGSQHVIGLTFD